MFMRFAGQGGSGFLGHLSGSAPRRQNSKTWIIKFALAAPKGPGLFRGLRGAWSGDLKAGLGLQWGPVSASLIKVFPRGVHLGLAAEAELITLAWGRSSDLFAVGFLL